MDLLTCPHCGQTYNPSYMQYCARCGEAVPDEHGKLPKVGPMDGMGARGGSGGGTRASASQEGDPDRPHEDWKPTRAVDDMVLEYRARLNETPDDHSTRYGLALAYLLARKWERAAEELALVVQGMPDYADAHFRLGVALAQSGKLSDGLDAARRAATLEPDNERYASVVERLEALVDNGN